MREVLDLSDVQSIVRLLGSVAERTPDPLDPALRKRTLVSGLARLIHADVWLWHQGRGVPPHESPMLFAELHGGYESEEQRTHHILALTDPTFDELCNKPVGQHCNWAGTRHITRTRRQLIGDAHWYGQPFHEQRLKPAGLDDCMLSFYLLDPKTWSAMGFWRKAGREPFSDRERCIAHVVTSEIDWLHRDGTQVPAADRVSQLSRRLKEVLLLTLAGDSRKQIAAKLEISPYTVADHHKALYTHFGVNTRAELMSRFLAGGGATGPSGDPVAALGPHTNGI
jgi:DNA-binding CsgD family transcriptional regulator